MQDIFYIPIKSESLAHYFSRAIILPAKYYSNKPEDIQNNYSDAILLTVSKWVENSDCIVEVIFNDIEKKDLIAVSENFFYYTTPIPISRVKSVCFLDAKQKDVTIWNINNGAAFIPESIISVDKDNDIKPVSGSEIQKSEKLKLVSDISDDIKRFDIILGGFAFMRLGGKSFMNYSPNYFSTLSYFNKLIEEQTKNAEKVKGLDFSNKYVGLFSKNESEWTKWQKYIYQDLAAQDIELLAEKEGEKFEKKLGIINIDSINPYSHLYELAILATYGERNNKSIDNLVTDMTNGVINADKVEDVAILFGLKNGYSKFRNKYRGALRDYDVKFALKSRLDYYIIESVFQFVFNGSKSNYLFDYIDKWCPSNKNATSLKGYVVYNILDTTVVAKKKQTPLEIYLESYSKDMYVEIFKAINQWIPPFAKSDEKMAIKYFENQLKPGLILSIESLQKRIEKEFEEDYNSQKQEEIEFYRAENEKLWAEIAILKEENKNLNSKNKAQFVSELLVAEMKENPEININDSKEKSTQKNVIREPITSDISAEYASLSITDLKKIAKERGLSKKTIDGFKKENKVELIYLIMKTIEPPKFL